MNAAVYKDAYIWSLNAMRDIRHHVSVTYEKLNVKHVCLSSQGDRYITESCMERKEDSVKNVPIKTLKFNGSFIDENTNGSFTGKFIGTFVDGKLDGSFIGESNNSSII